MRPSTQIILTHEHADFDAVASLVGLARLLPDAVPVLPRVVNANVEQFLRIFGRELPLRTRTDLTRAHVDHLWLVDTHKARPIRGITPDTPRSVIDHHLGVEEDRAAYVEYDVQPVGATATLVAERLMGLAAALPPLEATLLLLGIYEDTGSLTFRSTTPRDLRAAAWLLESGASLDTVRQFLTHPLSDEAQVPGVVKPAVLVASIMSRGQVRTLRPDQTVAEALEYARMVGHEGFPVLEGDRVLGVLTRRDLDRAAHHDLSSAPIRQILGGPPPLVTPADSVYPLQRLMLEHDLGQIPVVENGRLAGIVTRTDLLKLWAEADRHATGATRSIDLAAALTAEALEAIDRISATAAQCGDRAYLVGGLPRDLVLGIPPGPDIDVVIEGDAEAMARAVAERYGGRVRAHRQFGTAKWITEGVSIDLVSARAEYYRAPSALPTVERGSLQSDLRRRDFTINTLAIDLDPRRVGEVVDLFGGLADLARRQIRVLHSLSFVEDPTRIVRAVRLETRLGFRIEPRTLELMGDALDLLRRVSGVRLQNELAQVFVEPDPARALERLEPLGALAAIEPGLAAGRRTRGVLDVLPAAWALWQGLAPPCRLTEGLAPMHGLLLWLAEHGALGVTVAERLRLPRRNVLELQAVLALRSPSGVLSDPDAPASAVYHTLTRYRPVELCLAWIGLVDPTARYQVLRFAAHLAGVRTLVTGADLAKLGVAPGPTYGRVLHQLLDARLDGRVASRTEELALVRQLLAEDSEPEPRRDGR